MSKENVELVRTLTEAWQRRDQEETLDFVDPDVEWDATRLSETIPDVAGVYQGHDGVRTYWRRSGIEIELPPYAGVFTIRTGKIARVRWYPDQGSALEAVGLAR